MCLSLHILEIVLSDQAQVMKWNNQSCSLCTTISYSPARHKGKMHTRSRDILPKGIEHGMSLTSLKWVCFLWIIRMWTERGFWNEIMAAYGIFPTIDVVEYSCLQRETWKLSTTNINQTFTWIQFIWNTKNRLKVDNIVYFESECISHKRFTAWWRKKIHISDCKDTWIMMLINYNLCLGENSLIKT